MSMLPTALGWLEAVIFGLIQGLTEFLPVSSDGHLAIAYLLGLGSLPRKLEIPFMVLLHGGSLIAIAIAFHRQLLSLCRWQPRLWMLILVAMVPTGLVGLFCERHLEAVNQLWWAVGAGFALTAIFLLVAEQVASRQMAQGSLEQVGWRAALWVGALQALAPLPGVSRSGTTITGGLLGRLDPETAVAFSFVVGFPLILAANAKKALDGGFRHLHEACGPGPLVLAFVVTLVVSLAAIWLLRLVARRRLLWLFAIYCLILAGFCCGQWLKGG